MTALFWTELRGSRWNHSHSLGVTASNAPNYHRDHFWLSPPTSVPFISSTLGISFLLRPPSSWCYCQCEWVNLSHALICSLSATTMSASFAKSNLSVWNVESHQPLTVDLDHSQRYLPPGLWNFYSLLAAMFLCIFITTWLFILTVPAHFLVLFYLRSSLLCTQAILSALVDLNKSHRSYPCARIIKVSALSFWATVPATAAILPMLAILIYHRLAVQSWRSFTQPHGIISRVVLWM